MSRYTFSEPNGNEVAYGFDHIVGPFYQRFTPTTQPSEDGTASECLEDIDYMFSNGRFDCHALAERLQGHVDASHVSTVFMTAADRARICRHIHKLSLDLPI